jgi:hypothetical protein
LTQKPSFAKNWLKNPFSKVGLGILPGIEPSGIVFPSQNNNIVLYLFDVLQAMWELEIFSSAPRWLDDPLRVLC